MALTKYTEARPTRGTFRPFLLRRIGFRSHPLSHLELLIRFSETSLTTSLLILTHNSQRNPYLDSAALPPPPPSTRHHCRPLRVATAAPYVPPAAALYVPPPPHHLRPTTTPLEVPPPSTLHRHVPHTCAPRFWAPPPHTHTPSRLDGPPLPTRFPHAVCSTSFLLE